MRILYLEDDLRDADLTVRTLRKTAPDIQLETVSTVHEALARLDRIASDPLDLVLVDVRLRDGDGLSLLQHIRESSLPLAVVLVTGMGNEETAVAALKARADDYVVKHKDYLHRLPIILESALNHYRAGAARRTHPLKVLYAESHLPDIESTRLHLAVHADHVHMEGASTGPEALLALQPQDGSPRYDVLLMNLHLPELNALEVLRELRLTHQQDVPVVLVCREGDEELARQGLQLGASSYLVKSPGYLYQLPWQLEEAHSRADLLRREAALRASEARNRAILNAIPDQMFLLDRDGTFLDCHTNDLGLLPMPPEQFLGKRVVDVMPPHLAADLTRCFEQASDRPATLEFKLSVSEGPRLFEASIVSCSGDKILAIVRDITERKKAEESLKKALTEVQQLKDRLHEENIYLQEEIRVASNFGEIIGESQALGRVLRQAEQVAPINTTVLILGETGTGKELLAHAIHNLSPRHKHPLVKVNCTTLPAPLIESELFGHEKGAFTGASALRHGRFALADGGTIFLDEVGELPLDLQAKLLRVLEQGEFERVGSNHTVRVDVRVIAATNRNLAEAVRKGAFRSDLYYRLSIFPITLPPLRERREDIPILVTHFVKQLSLKLGKEIESVPQNEMAALQNYLWPGNIRELRNVIERAVIITQGSKLQLIDSLESLSLGTGPHVPDISFDSQPAQDTAFETLEHSEYNLILRTLKQVYWKIEGPGGAAELLKIHPSTLRTRMKKLGITKPKIQAAAGSR
jgi:PAS domain S-box-containing protein